MLPRFACCASPLLRYASQRAWIRKNAKEDIRRPYNNNNNNKLRKSRKRYRTVFPSVSQEIILIVTSIRTRRSIPFWIIRETPDSGPSTDNAWKYRIFATVCRVCFAWMRNTSQFPYTWVHMHVHTYVRWNFAGEDMLTILLLPCS